MTVQQVWHSCEPSAEDLFGNNFVDPSYQSLSEWQAISPRVLSVHRPSPLQFFQSRLPIMEFMNFKHNSNKKYQTNLVQTCRMVGIAVDFSQESSYNL